MGLFNGKRKSKFPADTLKRMEVFGRFEFDCDSGIDNPDIYDESVAPYRADAKADPDRFFTELAAVIAGDEGGFATFGAARLVWEIFDRQALTMPGALPIVDAGIDFMVARRLPTAHFNGYEHQRYLQRRGQVL